MSNNTHRGAYMLNTILRLPATKSQSGYSRSTIYLRITQGLWTKQISLGPRAIGWPAHEVAALNLARISGKTDDEIRELVKSLHAKRLNLARISGKKDDEIRELAMSLHTKRDELVTAFGVSQ